MTGSTRPDETTPRRGRLRRWAPWLLYAAVIVFIGYFLLTALLDMAPEAVMQLQVWVRSASLVGALVQALICLWIIAAWRPLIDWGVRRGVVRQAEYRQILAMRWRAARALVAYLLLIPIGITNVARFILGLVS